MVSRQIAYLLARCCNWQQLRPTLASDDTHSIASHQDSEYFEQVIGGQECAQLYGQQQYQGTMYGMLLESVQHFIQQLHGDQVWRAILAHCHCKNIVFTTHKRYNDELIVRIASACSEILGDATREEYFIFFGRCFVEYCSHYGYDTIMRVSGRYYRDFLHGIDNLHETMRFSYPKMLSPSFYVDEETEHGCILHYRSKRIGFAQYVIGQLKQMGTKFYHVNVDVDILKETVTDKGCHVVFQLKFNNVGFAPSIARKGSFQRSALTTHISGATFFKVFPFCIVFNKHMHITHCGNTLLRLFPNPLIGHDITTKFTLRRPQLMDFTWDNIICLQKVVFELESSKPISRHHSSHCALDKSSGSSKDLSGKTLLLKGQMRYIDDLSGLGFLCKPLLSNLEELQNLGLFLNDLNMHDSSREMVMAGWQHASRLEISIEKQIAKSRQIADNLRQLDEWQQKSENLLYSMIPQQIAVRLKNGEDPLNTCETFESVTIMFSYLLGFTDLCADVSPMDLVSCINSVFTTFDKVVDEHNVFKVETLGDAVYMVAGGVPDRKPNHASSVASVALELIDKVDQLQIPMNMKYKLAIRIGMHTGSVVAGVVGMRMPQYCLFGDTVNTASRMQTYSQAGRIHISEPCEECLRGTNFVTVFRDRVNIKGKGQLDTYWLVGKDGDPSTQHLLTEMQKEVKENKPLSALSDIKPDIHLQKSSEPGFDFRKRKYSEASMPMTIPLRAEKTLSPLTEMPATCASLPQSPLKSPSSYGSSILDCEIKFHIGDSDTDSEDTSDDDSTPSPHILRRLSTGAINALHFRRSSKSHHDDRPTANGNFYMKHCLSTSRINEDHAIENGLSKPVGKRRRASLDVIHNNVTLKVLDFSGLVPGTDVKKQPDSSESDAGVDTDDLTKKFDPSKSPMTPSHCPFSGLFSFSDLKPASVPDLSDNAITDNQQQTRLNYVPKLTIPSLHSGTQKRNCNNTILSSRGRNGVPSPLSHVSPHLSSERLNSSGSPPLYKSKLSKRRLSNKDLHISSWISATHSCIQTDAKLSVDASTQTDAYNTNDASCQTWVKNVNAACQSAFVCTCQHARSSRVVNGWLENTSNETNKNDGIDQRSTFGNAHMTTSLTNTKRDLISFASNASLSNLCPLDIHTTNRSLLDTSNEDLSSSDSMELSPISVTSSCVASTSQKGSTNMQK